MIRFSPALPGDTSMRYALQIQWANEPGVWQPPVAKPASAFLACVILPSADAASEFLALMRDRDAAAARRDKRPAAAFRIVAVA
jgi:hypothetical protein